MKKITFTHLISPRNFISFFFFQSYNYRNSNHNPTPVVRQLSTSGDFPFSYFFVDRGCDVKFLEKESKSYIKKRVLPLLISVLWILIESCFYPPQNTQNTQLLNYFFFLSSFSSRNRLFTVFFIYTANARSENIRSILDRSLSHLLKEQLSSESYFSRETCHTLRSHFMSERNF